MRLRGVCVMSLPLSPPCRYWTVTNIDYNNLRTPRRVFIMIFCVWFAALIVSLAPQFGWKDPEYMKRIEEQHCMVSQDVAYQVSWHGKHVHYLSLSFFPLFPVDLCHLLHVLCAAAGHIVPVLEDLFDCPQAYTASHAEVLQCDIDGDGGELLTGNGYSWPRPQLE